MCATATTSSSHQPKPEGTAGAHGLTGVAHKRFVIVTSLLSLIDPVRGEPTVHSLDRHPHDNSWRHQNLQKKFLDSFGLICSTSRVGGNTASAVCLEQGRPTGTVLRLVRNLGVPPDLINQLQQVLKDLTAVAGKGKQLHIITHLWFLWSCGPTMINTNSCSEMTVKEGEFEVLLKFINLTRDKIWSLLEKLRDPEIHSAVQQAISKMDEDDATLEDCEETSFRQWTNNLPSLVSLKPDTTPTQLIPHIKWAARAKWVYAEQMEALFCSGGGDLPL